MAERKERRQGQFSEVLNIKIDKNTRMMIEDRADERGLTLSDIAREVLSGWAKRQQRRAA